MKFVHPWLRLFHNLCPNNIFLSLPPPFWMLPIRLCILHSTSEHRVPYNFIYYVHTNKFQKISF
uniref:Putative ovule protein n=1 Tax=Solanum chacoense TaxID=4108 RepID=A0A0V0GN63_SOLCH